MKIQQLTESPMKSTETYFSIKVVTFIFTEGHTSTVVAHKEPVVMNFDVSCLTSTENMERRVRCVIAAAEHHLNVNLAPSCISCMETVLYCPLINTEEVLYVWMTYISTPPDVYLYNEPRVSVNFAKNLYYSHPRSANQEERRTDKVENIFLVAEQVGRLLFDVI